MMTAITPTVDKKYLFVGDDSGYLKQISLRTQRLIHDYGKPGNIIYSAATTSDNKYLFVNFCDLVSQYQIDSREVVKDYIFDLDILSIKVTPDSKYLFMGGRGGTLLQLCIDSRKVIKNYGEISDQNIWSMAVTKDSNFLVTGGFDNWEFKIDITSQRVVKEFRSYEPTPPSQEENLFVWYWGNNLVQCDLAQKSVIRDFGQVYKEIDSIYQQMLPTRSGEYLFKCGDSGGFGD